MCGPPDPTRKGEWYGEPWELAIVTDHLEAKAKLAQHMEAAPGEAPHNENLQSKRALGRAKGEERRKAEAAKADDAGGAKPN